MRAKQDASEARRALQIRLIQQQAALERLRAQTQAEGRARQVMDDRRDDHAAAQAGWREALGRATLDADAARHWRAHAAGALAILRAQEEAVRAQGERTAEHDEAWRRQVRLAEAAHAVERRTASRLRRRLDEKGLAAAEDLFRFARPSS